MKRESKYGTNKTIAFYQKSLVTRQSYFGSQQLSINKKYRWKLLDLLKERSTSSDYDNKIVVRRNHNYYQYNGYTNGLREHPPKHVSFPSRPAFVYQPYVNFIAVNGDSLELILHHGWKSSHHEDDLADLLNVDGEDISVTLVYFLENSEKAYSSDWYQACRHALGGSFAGFHSCCLGDYCPFGPTTRGQLDTDPRINQVLFILASNHKGRQRAEYGYSDRTHSRKLEQPECKGKRSQVKSQRRSKHMLTKEVTAVEHCF